MCSDAEQAAALLDQAERLDRERRHDEELVVYDEVVRRFAGSTESEVVEHVLRARLDKAITLYDLDREREALAVLDDLGPRADPGCEGESDDLRWLFARATKYQAYCLQALGRDTEALACYDELGLRFGDTTESDVLADVAEALREKARLLWDLNRHEEAQQAMEDMIRRLAVADDEDIADEVALASADHGHWLLSLDRHHEALEAYAIACRSPGLEDEELARVQYGRACALLQLGRRDQAIDQFDELARRFLRYESPVARTCAARAGNWQASLLWEAGRPAEAIAAHRAVAATPADEDVPDLRAERSRALLSLGAQLVHQGRGDEAILAYDELLVAFSDDERLAADVDHALRAKLNVLADNERTGETIVLADALAERSSPEDPRAAHVEATMSARGTALAAQGRFDEAIEAFDAAVAAVAGSDEPHLRCAAGLALCNKAAALGALGRTDEALAVQHEVADRYGADMLDVIQARLDELEADGHARVLLDRGRLRVRLAQTLAMCGRHHDAIRALDRVLAETEAAAGDAQMDDIRSVAQITRERLQSDD